MRSAICLLALLVLLASGQVAFTTHHHAAITRAATLQSDNGPKVLNVAVSKKKLYVTGENFAMGAVIMIDGKPQKTANDEDNPTLRLIAKKGGKKLSSNAISNITVHNPDGSTSEGFNFFKGRTVTLEDVGKTIELEVVEKFLLVLIRGPYIWTATVDNPAIVKLSTDISPVMGAVGIIEAVHTGQTDLFAVGEPACHNSRPPCEAPTLQFHVTLVVK